MAGLRVGQAYGGSHRPGFGLLGSVPRSLNTQPPFATQALKEFYGDISFSELGHGIKTVQLVSGNIEK